MTLKGIMAIILHYFADFGSFCGYSQPLLRNYVKVVD